jgi:HK97 family phage major capsid protein
LTRIPFNVNIAGQSSGGTAYWVGEAKPKPLTSFHFNSVNFRWAKIATISVLSDEMVRFSNPSAEVLVRDELAKAIGERMDIDFVDPGKAASTNVSPASITNGVTPSHSAGNTGDFIRSDVSTLLGGFDNYDIPLTNPAFIMSSTKARQLTLMRNSLGQREFPDMTLLGGSLEGIPVVASRYVSKFGTTGGEYVMLIHQPDIWYADDGQVTVDASREASLEMLDGSLTQDASGGTGASLVSMFQTNSVAVRAERYVNWARRRTGAVVVLDMCFWGSSHTSGT